MLIAAASGGDPVYYLLAAPASVVVAIAALWLSQRGERRARAEREAAQIERDRRLHSAMFGYREGNTEVPGVWNVVVGGNGTDGLGVIAHKALDTAEGIAAKQTVIEGEVDIIKDMATAAAVASSENTTSILRVEEKVDAAVPLAEEAAQKAAAAAKTTEAALEVIANHVDDDLHIHEQQRVALTAIGAQVGADVMIPRPTPARKATAAKKVAKAVPTARKQAARRKPA